MRCDGWLDQRTPQPTPAGQRVESEATDCRTTDTSSSSIKYIISKMIATVWPWSHRSEFACSGDSGRLQSLRMRAQGIK